MKLTITDKVFVPVSVKNELPEDKTAVFILENRGSSTLTPRMNLAYFEYPTNFNTGDEEDNYPTHWLKEETNKYVLSKEELEKVISDACDKLRPYISFNDLEDIKEEYINLIL
jgi:hypothetical protein